MLSTGYYYFMSFECTLTVIIVVPFIIAGTASMKCIFCVCICNSLKAHSQFGKCPFRDMGIELVRRQFFDLNCLVPSEVIKLLNPTSSASVSKWGLNVSLWINYTQENFLRVLCCGQLFWEYNLARDYHPYLLFYKRGPEDCNKKPKKCLYFTYKFYSLLGEKSNPILC